VESVVPIVLVVLPAEPVVLELPVPAHPAAQTASTAASVSLRIG
jgi:hypothetical protein